MPAIAQGIGVMAVELIVLVVIVLVLVFVVIRLNSKDSNLENLSPEQMSRQVQLLRQWIDKYETLPNPPDDLKQKYEYKKNRLNDALRIWGQKIKDASTQEEVAPIQGVGDSLRRQLDEFEAGIKNLDPASLCSIGANVEFLQDGFAKKYGSFEEFVSKGGDLSEYVNLLLTMARESREKGNVYREWASRLCAIHASAVHIEDSELAVRAKVKIDELVKQSSMFDR